jgi:hypothetical protein
LPLLLGVVIGGSEGGAAITCCPSAAATVPDKPSCSAAATSMGRHSDKPLLPLLLLLVSPSLSLPDKVV